MSIKRVVMEDEIGQYIKDGECRVRPIGEWAKDKNFSFFLKEAWRTHYAEEHGVTVPLSNETLHVNGSSVVVRQYTQGPYFFVENTDKENQELWFLDVS